MVSSMGFKSFWNASVKIKTNYLFIFYHYLLYDIVYLLCSSLYLSLSSFKTSNVNHILSTSSKKYCLGISKSWTSENSIVEERVRKTATHWKLPYLRRLWSPRFCAHTCAHHCRQHESPHMPSSVMCLCFQICMCILCS